MHMRRFVALGAVAALLLIGCGSASEKAAEQLIERGSGGNVDLSDGGMSFESEDGSFSVDADGNIQVDSEDGSFSMENHSGQLADGFPDVPLPDDAVLVTSSKQTSDGETTYQATFQTSLDEAEAFEQLQAAYESAGYEPQDESVTQGNGSFMAYATFVGPDYSVFTNVFGDGDEAMVSVMVMPAES